MIAYHAVAFRGSDRLTVNGLFKHSNSKDQKHLYSKEKHHTILKILDPGFRKIPRRFNRSCCHGLAAPSEALSQREVEFSIASTTMATMQVGQRGQPVMLSRPQPTARAGQQRLSPHQRRCGEAASDPNQEQAGGGDGPRRDGGHRVAASR